MYEPVEYSRPRTPGEWAKRLVIVVAVIAAMVAAASTGAMVAKELGWLAGALYHGT